MTYRSGSQNIFRPTYNMRVGHWAFILFSGNVPDTTVDLLGEFCSSQLLNWLGVMSLLGDLDGAITALHSARESQGEITRIFPQVN